MMVTERQIKILEFYLDHENNFIPAKKLASELNVSIQTIKNDLKNIHSLSKQALSFQLNSVPNKGTKLMIKDLKKLRLQIKNWKQQEQKTVDNKENRSNLIISYLLNSYGYVSKTHLMNHFYIRDTTLYKQMKEIKQELPNFGLKLEYKTNYGYIITGSELNKRTYLTHLGVDYKNKTYEFLPEDTTKVYNIVADAFFNHKYHIDEEILQNITAHIFIAVQRISHSHFITETTNSSLENTEEYQIALEILQKILKGFRINPQYFSNEVSLLTQIILGKMNYISDDLLQEKMNRFLNEAFKAIYTKFSINFETVDNIKLLLILHLVPLYYRVHSGTQLTNPLEEEIHQSFPQAYDIALYFSQLLEKNCDLKISKSELSFLVLYFNFGIENYLSTASGKKILIITSLRKSETILLRHKILNWFPNQIEELSFAYPDEYKKSIDSDDFDAIFTTEADIVNNQGEITYINLFPSEKDYKKINLALNGFDSINSILEKFDPACFYYGKINTKKEVLDLAIKNAMEHYQLAEDFMQSVKDREALNSTYFGNKIAVPHTASPVSNDKFVSIVALKDEIKWDSCNSVNLILLVSIAKNNPKEFQFWYYISSLIQDPTLLNDFRKNPTFNSFEEVIKKALKDKFN